MLILHDVTFLKKSNQNLSDVFNAQQYILVCMAHPAHCQSSHLLILYQGDKKFSICVIIYCWK